MATPPGKVPISESAAAGLKFLTDHWQKLLPASALMGVITAAYFLSMTSPSSGVGLLTSLAFLAGLVVVSASFYRLAIHNEYPAPSGFAFGRDETNYFSASLWSSLPFVAIMAPVMVGAFSFLDASAKKAGYTLEQLLAGEKLAAEAVAANGGGGLLALLFLAAIVLVMWLFLRLSLAMPATIGERKIKVWATFKWTKGNVWRILAAILLLWLPLFILSQVILSIVSLSLGINPAEAQAGKAPVSAALGIYGFITGAISALLGTAPITGLLAFLYKGLRPPS
jgi:hypothetical protein